MFVVCLYTLGKTHVCVCLFYLSTGSGPLLQATEEGSPNHAEAGLSRQVAGASHPQQAMFCFVYTHWGKPKSLFVCLYSVGEAHEFVVLFILNGGNPRVCFSCLYSMGETQEFGLVVYTLWGKPMCRF